MKTYYVVAKMDEGMEIEAESKEEAIDKMRDMIQDYVADIVIEADEIASEK